MRQEMCEVVFLSEQSWTRDAGTGIVLSKCGSLRVTLTQNDPPSPLASLSMKRQPCHFIPRIIHDHSWHFVSSIFLS